MARPAFSAGESFRTLTTRQIGGIWAGPTMGLKRLTSPWFDAQPQSARTNKQVNRFMKSILDYFARAVYSSIASSKGICRARSSVFHFSLAAGIFSRAIRLHLDSGGTN